MAAAFLQSDDLPQALKRVEVGERLAPHHPVVAYLRGKVWFELAQRAGEATEESSPGDQPGRGLPPTPMVERAVYEMMAIADFQEAIEREDVVDPADALVPFPVLNGQRTGGPCVGELLAAIGGEQFVGHSHRLLYRLHLRRQEFTDAEQQLDQAVQVGVAAFDDHRTLVAAMIEAGDQTAAVRVLGKDMRLHYPWIYDGCQRLRNWMQGAEPWVW
jgi:hypothetical protein